MSKLPKKAVERISSRLKRFQDILAGARSRDINESDTVMIVTDLLQDVFGYDKFTEITSEYMIRNTFCDLALELDGELAFLIEVKAIGLELKESHVKQAVDYAANKGCNWVVLTNGIAWQVFKITFAQPIDRELVVSFDLLAINARKSDDLELLGLLSKEGWQRSRLGDYHSLRQVLNRFTLGTIIQSDAVIDLLRREIRRISPDVRAETDEIRNVVVEGVLKREVVEGEKAEAARKQVTKATKKALRAKVAAASSLKSCKVDNIPTSSSELA